MINPDTWPVRQRMQVEDGAGGAAGGSVRRLLDRMRHSAFQGRKLGEAFATWTWMIDQGCLIAMGLAGSMASAGLAPLLIWLVERGYVDVLVSTSANATEDLLEARGTPFYQVDPDHVDDRELWQQGFYRFYDHVVSAREYDRMEDFTSEFFEHLAKTWPSSTIAGVHFTHELGRWLDGGGLTGSLAATCFRHGVPLFVPAAPDGPLAEGYRTAARKGPSVDFFRDYDIALDIMSRYMSPGPGTAAIFAGGGVPKDFIQITATSVATQRGNGQASPHVAAIQITTDNTVFGGLGGAGVHTECISWGKEAAEGRNVMVFTDLTIALPLLCQGLAEHYGPGHMRPARAAIAADLRRALPTPAPASPRP
ncbi:MAG TPA: deoxyhypusine synthase family protein [Terriglobales bacterium]|nr:deoxyhypusine synthase family protein [Terriglobales bacterium]